MIGMTRWPGQNERSPLGSGLPARRQVWLARSVVGPVLYFHMDLFRRPLARRILTLLLGLALMASLGESGIADVHDGDATHAELDRATGASHERHADSSLPERPADPYETSPDHPDHPVHVCHCIHVHLGLLAESTLEIETVEHSEPATASREVAPPAVALELWTPPPIA